MNSVDHQFCQDRLSAYADNELPLSERAQIEAHLQTCADCRRRLSEIRKLSELVGQVSPLPESDYWEQSARKIEDALARTDKVIDLGHERAKRSSLWWKMPAIAASILILGYIGFHESDIFKREILVPPREGASLPPKPSQAPQLSPMETPESTLTEPKRDTATAGKLKPQGPVSRGAEPSKSVAVPRSESASEKKEAVTEQPKQEAMPPVPTEQLAEPSAKPVATAPSQEAQRPESNYVARYRDRTAASLADTNAVADSLSSVETLAKKSEEARAEAEELASWRLRRDSLLSVTAKLSDTASASLSGALKFSAVPPKPQEQGGPLGLVSRQFDAEVERKEAEEALVNAWFEICRLSTDSIEVNKGVTYLRSVADNKESPSRKLAEKHLKQLGKQ